jgi:hypothetical protein
MRRNISNSNALFKAFTSAIIFSLPGLPLSMPLICGYFVAVRTMMTKESNQAQVVRCPATMLGWLTRVALALMTSIGQ